MLCRPRWVACPTVSVRMCGVQRARAPEPGRVTEARFSLATRLVCYEAADEDRRDLLMLGFFVLVWAALIAAT